MPAAKRRALERFERADRSPPRSPGSRWRGAQELLGRRRDTLGAEWMLAHAFAWRRLLSATTRDPPTRFARLDSLPPPAFDPRPGARAPAEPAVRAIAEKIAPLRLAVSDDAPRRVNLLIPSIDLQHFFGGYIGKFNLARRLAARGERVRDRHRRPGRRAARELARRRRGLQRPGGLLDAGRGRVRARVAGHRDEPRRRLIATTWWTAHIAAAALRSLDADRFLYLIQEYEPFTFPMGTYAALAAESYRSRTPRCSPPSCCATTSGATGSASTRPGRRGDAASTAFDNAITAIDPPAPPSSPAARPRRLLFYARPEPHAARNMFELGVLALSRALERGAFADGWELHGIGSVRAGRRLDLGGGALMELHPRAAQAGYGAFLREHDVGLALMYTPHPSLVPLEMASAGLVTVTNTFENKTAEAMPAISRNLIAAEPGIEAIAARSTRPPHGPTTSSGALRGSTCAGPGTGRSRSPSPCWSGWSACCQADRRAPSPARTARSRTSSGRRSRSGR